MKNLLLTSVLILTSAAAFSQLFVRPTPGGSSIDSYVYVKNEIVYVTGDVNLQKNAAGNFEASVYLRNQGQLIQGGTTSENKGDGFLSVQQNTLPTNAFAYYYWCSPVGNPVANGGSGAKGNKNFGLGSIYEDKNTVIGEGTKASLSANISGLNGFSSPLTISKRWSYTLATPGTEDQGNWVRMEAGNNAPAGFGFTMKGVNEGTAGSNTANITLDQTYEFRGRPNNGDFVIPVNNAVGTDPRMTLTGNPYPSALDLNQVFAGNDKLAAIYFYDEDRSKMTHNYSGKPYGYGVWIPNGVDPTPKDGSIDYPGIYAEAAFYIWDRGITHGGTVGTGTTQNNKRYAPIGQGFMFVGTESANVTIRNSYRVFQKEGAANYSVFQRSGGDDVDTISDSSDNNNNNNVGNRIPNLSAIPQQIDNRGSQLRLYVVFDDALTRDLVLSFSPQATLGYDRGYDGPSPFQMKSDAYFPIVSADGQKMPYVIQGTKFDAFDQIPITFKLHKASSIEVRAVEEIRKPYQKVYLYDQQENTYRPLVSGHSLAGTFTLPAGTYENRFFLIFRARNDSDRPDGGDNLDQAKVDIGLFQNNPARQLEVSNPEGYNLKSASIYDMSGKLVISENDLGDNSNYSFYTGNLSTGVYIVKLITSDDITINYKAMVINK